MDITKLVQNLKDNEEIKVYYRQFFVAWFWNWFGAFLVFLSPFFLLYLLLRYGLIGQMSLVVLLGIGVIWIMRTWRVWRGNVLIITTRRLVMVRQVGVFDRTVSQISLDKINDVSFRQQSFWQNFFNYGAMLVQISASPEKIILPNIRQPAIVQQIIFDLQSNFGKDEKQEFTEAELLAVIREIRSKIGEKRWRQIVEGDWDMKQDLIEEVQAQDPVHAEAIQQFFTKEVKKE